MYCCCAAVQPAVVKSLDDQHPLPLQGRPCLLVAPIRMMKDFWHDSVPICAEYDVPERGPVFPVNHAQASVMSPSSLALPVAFGMPAMIAFSNCWMPALSIRTGLYGDELGR